MKEKAVIDDSTHDVMYISPGAHPGGFGRTFDWHPVRTDAERTLLGKRGYSTTLEAAYEAADAKSGKAAPVSPALAKRPLLAEADDRDPITGEAPAPVGGLLPAAGPSLEDVKAALTKLKDAKDAKAVTALLKGFDAASMPKLKPEQYADVIAAAEAAAKKE